MSSDIDVASFISISLLYILSIISICWLYSYYSLRNEIAIQKRRPLSSMLCSVLCIIGLMITYPSSLLFSNTTSISNFTQQNAIIIILILFTNILFHHIFTYRVYMIYFQLRVSEQLQDSPWRLYIDPKEENWYLQNQKSWGNAKRITLILGIHFVFWCVIVAIFLFNNTTNSIIHLLLSLSVLLTTICDIIVYIKFPKFDDAFCIAKEIKWTLLFELFFIIIISMISYIINPAYHSYTYLVFTNLSGICLFIYVFIIHYVPLKQNDLPTNPYRVKQYLNLQMHENRIRGERYGGYYNDYHPNKERRISDEHRSTLQQIVNDENGLNQFARHLQKEFSIEYLLFLIETEQLLSSAVLLSDKQKEYLVYGYIKETVNGILSHEMPLDIINLFCLFYIQRSGYTESRERNKSILSFKLTANVPRSQIVYSPQTDSDNIEYIRCFQCAQLFKKYITNDSYFCINICYETRDALYKQYGGYYNDNVSAEKIAEFLMEKGMATEQLFYSFDESRKEITRLMYSSFYRFVRTDEYQQLIHKL